MNAVPLSDLLPRLARVRERTLALTEGVPASGLLWQPAPDKWGIAQVFEHLYRLHTIYEANIRRTLDEAPPTQQTSPLEPGWFARVFGWAIDERMNLRMPTAPFMEPRDASPESPRRFLECWDTFGAQLREAECKDQRQRVRLAVPILSLRLGEVFPVLTGHAERHLSQAERVREASGFPA
jgi:hypothetical protein